MSEVLNKIKTRGYWEVIIRPNGFVENLIESPAKCKEIIRELNVKWRGWYYPHYSYTKEPTAGQDYIEQSMDSQHYVEFWRYYQSGQFIHFFGMIEDWQDQVTAWNKINLKPFEALEVVGALCTFTEIYEFASRLAAKGLLGNECKISITLHGTKDRKLVVWGGRTLSMSYISQIESISPRERSFSTTELMGKSTELSLEHAIFVFQRFNWDNPPRSVLIEDQKKLIEGRL